MAFERVFHELDPFGELTQIHRRLTNMLEREGMPRLRGWIGAPEYPPLNVYVTPADVVVAAEAPGIDAAAVEITVVNNVLTLRGSRAQETGDGVAWYRRERTTGEFSRSVALPEKVDGDRASASYNKGILTVVLPRAEESKPRRISVTTTH